MALTDSTAYNVTTLLASGLILALVTSYITEKKFASPSAQLLPYAKYITILGYVALERSSQPVPRKRLSRLGARCVMAIGALSVVAYCLYCIGFAMAGTGLALGMHAAMGQSFTAVLSRLLLKRKLSALQIWSVLIVNAGLLLRGLNRHAKATTPAHAPSGGTAYILGAAAITGSSLCYALLGVVFDYLLKLERPAPPYSQIMEVEGWMGIAALTLWQAVYTAPQWEAAITKPLQHSGVTASGAVALLLASGIIFIWHYYNMTNMFRAEGAIAVGLVNAVRGAAVSLVAGRMNCSVDRPEQCNSFWTVSSALVVTAGAILWTLEKPPPKSVSPHSQTSKKTALEAKAE